MVNSISPTKQLLLKSIPHCAFVIKDYRILCTELEILSVAIKRLCFENGVKNS